MLEEILNSQKLKTIYFPVKIYFLWRIIIAIYQAIIQYNFFNLNKFSLYEILISNWSKSFDAVYYLNIAQKGYIFPEQTFFPFWPITIKIINYFINNIYLTSYILSLMFGLIVFILFYKLAIILTNQKQARQALLIFTAFPSTMFLIASYTEGPFIALTLLSFILLEKKYYILSSITGSLALFTRLAGLSISSSYLFIKTKYKTKLIMILISLLGLISYMIYLKINFNDPFYFIEAQKNWCIRFPCRLTFPLLTPIIFLIKGFYNQPYQLIIDWTVTIIFLLLSITVYQHLPKIYFIYTLSILCIWLTSGKIISMSRYVLPAFPVFYIIPSVIKESRYFLLILLLLFGLQLIFITLHSSLLWIA